MSFFGNLSSLFGAQTQKGADKKTTKPVINQRNSQQQPVHKGAKSDPKSKKSRFQSKKDVGFKSKTSPDSGKSSQIKLDDTSLREAQAKAREIIVEAKDEALAIRSDAEKKARQSEQQIVEQQRILQNQLDKLDNRLSNLADKEDRLDKEEEKLEALKKKLEETKQKVVEKLEKVAGLTKSEARQQLLDGLEKKLSTEMAQIIRQRQEEAKQEADEKVQEILIDAMKHGATDNVAEYTVSVVTIPSEEIKGKIIGKSGRNIHAFERATGVDVDLDSSPTEVKLSCFDPVRREIGRIALERLIKDGRIQPALIEEVVAKVKGEIEKITFEAGKKLCHTVGVYNLPNGLMQMLGRFKYRFSYGQNMITHTIEETKIGIKLAHEMGLDVNIVKLGCLLHDVGKVAEDPDDSHVVLGVKIAKKYGMPQAVVDCIAQHHEDEPFTGPEQMAVYISDAISGARPGARYENFDEYIKRLENLEKIATAYDEVKEAYAIQAGRELRVLLLPDKSKDDDVTVLALKIKDEIEEKLTYPGTVKVTVIREVRGREVAK